MPEFSMVTDLVAVLLMVFVMESILLAVGLMVLNSIMNSELAKFMVWFNLASITNMILVAILMASK